MPKHNNLYTKTFDQTLLGLVDQIGENKWAEITRQMKNIYNYDIPRKAMVQARWRAIDPKINRDPFTAEDLATHWSFCVRHKCNWDMVKAEYKDLGQERDKSYLSQKFYAYFQSKLIELNKSMGKIPIYNRQKIEMLRDTTKKRILELNNRPVDNISDEQTKEVVMSCKMAIKVLSFAVENHSLKNDVMIEQMQKYIISRDKFQKMLENLFIIDYIVLIACNFVVPIDEQQNLKKKQNEKGPINNYRKPKQIKKWDESLDAPSSEDFKESKNVLEAGFKLIKNVPNISLTKAEIEIIKESVLYQVCNTDQNMTFYDWYNEAKIQKTHSKLDFTHEIENPDANDDVQSTQHTDKVQKKLHQVKRQIKALYKKQEESRKEKENLVNKIQTVRGTIRCPKELFPGCYTKFFDGDSENEDDFQDHELSYLDVEQIYQLNRKDVKKQIKVDKKSRQVAFKAEDD